MFSELTAGNTNHISGRSIVNGRQPSEIWELIHAGIFHQEPEKQFMHESFHRINRFDWFLMNEGN